MMRNPLDDFEAGVNERDLFGNDPDPLTPTEWLIIVTCLTGALGIIGGLIYLCLLIIRG